MGHGGLQSFAEVNYFTLNTIIAVPALVCWIPAPQHGKESRSTIFIPSSSSTARSATQSRLIWWTIKTAHHSSIKLHEQKQVSSFSEPVPHDAMHPRGVRVGGSSRIQIVPPFCRFCAVSRGNFETFRRSCRRYENKSKVAPRQCTPCLVLSLSGCVHLRILNAVLQPWMVSSDNICSSNYRVELREAREIRSTVPVLGHPSSTARGNLLPSR